MPEPRDGTMGDAELEKLMQDPDKMNDPAAVASLAAQGIVAGKDPAGDVEEAKEVEEKVEGAGEEAAGEGTDTAGEEPPAQTQEDPEAKSIRLEAENRIYREMLERGIGGKPKEETPPPPPVKPARVVEWEKLAAVDPQTARAHYEKLTADGNTFEAERFLSAWQTAPGHLAHWQEQEAFKARVENEKATEASNKAAVELRALTKSHPDWQKYADVMEDLAKRDAAAQKAGFESAFATMEDLYQEAVRKKGGTPTAAPLSEADKKRKDALGRGPSSRRGGSSAPGAGSKANPEQELIRSILRDEVRI